MLEKWFESVFWKRVGLAGAAVFVAQWAAHSVSVLNHLDAWGVTATIKINQDQLAQHLTTVLVALSQGAHEWVSAKYPAASKWL